MDAPILRVPFAILSEAVCRFVTVEDVLSVRATCRTLGIMVISEPGMQWFWWVMIRRVAHRRKYAYDLDGCYTLRRIGIRRALRATNNYMPIYSIQEARTLFGECMNDRHLYKNVMTVAKEQGTTTENLYRVWRRYVVRRRKQKEYAEKYL